MNFFMDFNEGIELISLITCPTTILNRGHVSFWGANKYMMYF